MPYEAPAPAASTPAVAEYAARKGKGVMPDEEFQQIVRGALSQSVQFVDTELSVERARATEYYLGKPFGNEEEGRSQAILTEVRDAADGMLPSLLRVFFGPEHMVEFVPDRADSVAMAEQQTDYVRYVLEQDNAGFLELLAVLKDGLIRKLGIIKWGWDESEDTKAYRLEGLDEEQVKLLASDDDVQLTKVERRVDPQSKQTLSDVELTKTTKGGRCWIKALPPEEFIFNRQARDTQTALLLAHRTDKTKGQLVAMGISKKDIDAHAGSGNATDVTLKGNAEEIARRDVAGVGRVVGFGYTNDPDMGTENSKVLYTEAFLHVDYDGDGIAELRKVCCIGPTYYPVSNEPTDEAPFAVFTPYPEPHTLIGGSLADRTMDIQKINSSLLRGMLDSLAASIFPRTVVNDQVSVADVMNTAIGAPIRVKGDVNANVKTLEMPFVGQQAMPVMQFMQEVVERRTGRNKGAAGLDADALQSTGKEAVGAVLTGSQEQIEMIARVFAEMTLKPLFKGVGRMIRKYQNRPRMIRLRGQWVEVDPRPWTDDMDVTVNVALGNSAEQKIQTLAAVIDDQKEMLSALGPTNPVVTLPMLRNAKAKLLRLRGIQDVDNYYKPLPPDWQPPPPPPPPPDPNQAAMESEKQMNQLKTVKELAIKQDEFAFEREKWEWERQFEYDKLAADIAIRREQIAAQFKVQLTQAQTDADVQEAELTLKTHDQLHDQHLERQAQAHEQDLAEHDQAMQADQQQHEQQMDQMQAAEPEGAE